VPQWEVLAAGRISWEEGLKKVGVNESRGGVEQEWSWTLFEALRPSERPRVREHNSKCMKAKGEGPHDSLRETRARRTGSRRR
jgi:hypothetical protein